jgi:hypothetical protein
VQVDDDIPNALLIQQNRGNFILTQVFDLHMANSMLLESYEDEGYRRRVSRYSIFLNRFLTSKTPTFWIYFLGTLLPSFNARLKHPYYQELSNRGPTTSCRLSTSRNFCAPPLFLRRRRWRLPGERMQRRSAFQVIGTWRWDVLWLRELLTASGLSDTCQFWAWRADLPILWRCLHEHDWPSSDWKMLPCRPQLEVCAFSPPLRRQC